MRATALIVLALAASPVEARPWQCVLWPNTCQMDQPPPEAAPAPVQAAPIPEVVAPPATVARVKARPPVAKPRPRIRSKWVKPRRKQVAVPSWCSRVPKGTTMAQIEAAAPAWGVTLTPASRRQAEACLRVRG